MGGQIFWEPLYKPGRALAPGGSGSSRLLHPRPPVRRGPGSGALIPTLASPQPSSLPLVTLYLVPLCRFPSMIRGRFLVKPSAVTPPHCQVLGTLKPRDCKTPARGHTAGRGRVSLSLCLCLPVCLSLSLTSPPMHPSMGLGLGTFTRRPPPHTGRTNPPWAAGKVKRRSEIAPRWRLPVRAGGGQAWSLCKAGGTCALGPWPCPLSSCACLPRSPRFSPGRQEHT